MTKDIAALRVSQWLGSWEKVPIDEEAHRAKPPRGFYLLSMSAGLLRVLSGIQRRTTKGRRLGTKDLGIQRRHDEDRSSEIAKFIQYGYPWSELSEAKRRSGRFDDLRKPGWLPTAIVVNILKHDDTRHASRVAARDLIEVHNGKQNYATVQLPAKCDGIEWKPTQLPPLEVIDGQHRLWAFDATPTSEDFELPVVAFHGLDISWQAYLFWTINIKPKRINASLAFDLYPLLRTEDWLEKIEGHSIYRETRAQELVEALWAHPESPWQERINMLGEPGLRPMVSQAAWIRSLTATFIRSKGGLFSGKVTNGEVLAWSRAQQAAFLIFIGRSLRENLKNSNARWVTYIRKEAGKSDDDPAFYGEYSLLSTDQGIRGLLHVSNEICFIKAEELALGEWRADENGSASDESAVTRSLKSLNKHAAANFLNDLARALATYDWRTSSSPGLTEDERTPKAALRGSSGYKEMRVELLRHLKSTGDQVGRAASRVLAAASGTE